MERQCLIRKAEARLKTEKHDPNLNPNCVGQYQSKKKCSTLVFRKCYNLSRSCTSHHLCTGLKKLLVIQGDLCRRAGGVRFPYPPIPVL